MAPPQGSVRSREAPPLRQLPTRPQLVAAVKQFQSDSGTKPDGVLGQETIEALSTGPGRPRPAARRCDGAAPLVAA